MSELLPQAIGHMEIGQGVYLELLHLLVSQKVITETAALENYKELKVKYNAWI